MAVGDTFRSTLRSAGGFNPLHASWRALTSIRFALFLLGAVIVGALLGTFFPQIPGPMRGNAAATSAWIELQKGTYGPFTEPLYRLGMFEVFRTYWFNGLLVVVLLAVTVCTANRFAPTWRSVSRLQTRVGERYFMSARHRARRDAAVEPDALVAALRRRHYLVRRAEEGGTVYLYADRFRWAQLATFVSHLSLILLLAGGLVTRLVGYDASLYIAEGQSAPVYPVLNPRQMQVEVKEFIEGRDAEGRITDFRSRVVIYDRGRPVKEGEVTVNGPLKWGGFVFHQVARQVNGAELQVREVASGNVVYREVLDLAQGAPRPRLTIRDARDRVLFDERLLLPLVNTRGPAGGGATLIPNPAGGANLTVALRPEGEDWRMEVVALGGTGARVLASLGEGETVEAGGLTYTFAGLGEVAWAQVGLIPGVVDGAVALLTTPGRAGLRSAVDGSAALDAGQDEEPVLVITNPVEWGPAFAGQGLAGLEPGVPVVVGDYEYTFLGRRAFTGLVARRDPGTAFIWLGVTLFIAAVCVTFYFPRRRAWFALRREETLAAGVADRGSRYGEELGHILDEVPVASRTPKPAAARV